MQRLKAASMIVVTVLLLLPALYVISAGPMTPVLNHSGDSGYRAWQIIYGEPLSRLPKPLRQTVNRYIGFCDIWYYKLKRNFTGD